MSLVGQNNTILFNGCKSLKNLTVTLQVAESLITLNDVGFSLQLNCYPQPTPTVNGKPLKLIQYVIAVVNNSVQWQIQYWSAKTVPKGKKGFGFSAPNNVTSFGSFPSNVVLAGSVIEIALATDSKGNVTSATFSITDPNGNVSSYTYPSSSDLLPLCAIYGFQVNLVAPPSAPPITFTQGAGILTYSVSSGTLAVQSTNTCKIAVSTTSGFSVIKGGAQIGTSEQSNIPYGTINPASGSTVSQSVGPPPPYTNPPLTPTTYIPIPNLAFHTTLTSPVALNDFVPQSILRLANLPGATHPAPTGVHYIPVIPGKYVVFGRVCIVNQDPGGDPQDATVQLITENASVLDRVDTRIAGFNQMQGDGEMTSPITLSITGSLSISLQGTLDTIKLRSNTVYLQASTYQGYAAAGASLIAISVDDILAQTGTQNKPTWKSTDAAKTSGSIF